jgi:hypothetical protein
MAVSVATLFFESPKKSVGLPESVGDPSLIPAQAAWVGSGRECNPALRFKAPASRRGAGS